jgi:hypothetical protein
MRRTIQRASLALLGSALSALMVLFAVAAPQGAQAGPVHAGGTRLSANTSSKCAFSANPYSMRRSLLAECGYTFVPRSGVQALPGGGESYIYHLGKLTIRYNVPPRGFDILTASPAKLREYNLPSRKVLGTRWAAEMRKASITAPPASLIEGPEKFATVKCSTPNGSGSCWAGYVDTGHSDYDNASANWVEPSISSDACGEPAGEGTWVGLGGYTSSDLGQDGTAYGTGHPHGAWWEILPNGAVYSDWTGAAGDSVSAVTAHESSGYTFYVEEGSHVLNPAVQGGAYSGTTADYIIEAPGTYLANFGTLPFSAAYSIYGASGQYGVGQLPHTEVIMKNVNGSEMAQPKSIYGPNSDDFTIEDNACD